MIDDPQVPVRDLLLGPDAVEVLSLAVAQNGGVCTAAKPRQVRYIPGSSITVQYDAKVRWGDEAEASETLVVRSGRHLPAEAVRLDIDGTDTSVWRYSNDPYLPGLAAAADKDAVLNILGQLGVNAGEVKLRRRAYRAGRRAVIEAVSPQTRLFIKVVRPSRVQRLQEIHQSVAGELPVPHSFGWDADLGIVVIEALPGETLRKAIASSEYELPGGSELVGLLDRMSSIEGLDRRVAGPVERLRDHIRLLSAVLPHTTERLYRLVEEIAVPPEPEVAVHGDFHASQVITDHGKLVGLIDLDTMGRGERSNDLATMIGQISTLALRDETYRKYGVTLINYFDQMVDPVGLRYRTAAVVVGFATGPFRVQMPDWETEAEKRIALAERWMDAAQA